MDNQFMVDPISEVGRSVMQATDNMTPEQKATYAQQNQMMGIAPQQALETMMAQQQQLRNFKPQQPTMPTVRDKLAQAVMQMQQGLGAIPTGVMNNASYAGGGIVAFSEGGVSSDQVDRILKKHPVSRTAEDNEILRRAGLQLERRAPLPRDSALATFDRFLGTPFIREAVGSPYASDADVAKGGTANLNEALARMLGAEQAVQAPVEDDMVQTISKGPTTRGGPRKKDKDSDKKQSTDIARVAARPVAVPAAASAQETPSGYEARLEQIRKLQEAQGIGGASSALAALLDREEAAGKQQAADDRRMALAQAGFAMAEAAGRPGAKFLGAAGAGGQSYVAGRAAADKAARDYQRTLARERINLQRADEALKMGNINLAIQLEGQAEERAAKAKEVASRNALAYYTAGLEATLGKERTAATLRGQNLETMLKISEQTAEELGNLAMNPQYLKAKPEDQVRMRNAVMERGNKMVGNMLGAGALGDTKSLSGGIKFLGFEG